jgi:hypothetical protein
MRCVCCNRNLNDAESTARHPETNEFLDTCMPCLKEIGISPVIREDLNPYEQFDEEGFSDIWEDDNE